MNTSHETRERMQKSLPTLRNIAGISAEELANMLDVSRQTIASLENSEELKMSVIQYRAIRSVFDELAVASDDDTLKRVISILVDQEDVPESLRNDICNQAVHAVKSVGRKLGSEAGGKAAATAVKNVTVGDLKISEIPLEKILRGAAVFAEILGKSMIRSGEESDLNG